MSDNEKTPCEVCGKLVTTHPGARSCHMSQHRDKGMKDEVKKSTDSAAPVAASEAASVEQAAPVNAPAATEPQQFADVADQRRYEAGLQAQARLLKAPNILASDQTDPRMELRKQYAPDTLDRMGKDTKGRVVVLTPAPYQAFFGDRDKCDLYANRGYLPVKNEHRRQVEHEGQLMFKRDRRISDAAVQAARDASRRRSANLHTTVRELQTSPQAAVIEQQEITREEIPQK